jgi:hypothetical protein
MVFNSNRSTVTFDFFKTDGKPEPGSGMFGGEERTENLFKKISMECLRLCTQPALCLFSTSENILPGKFQPLAVHREKWPLKRYRIRLLRPI